MSKVYDDGNGQWTTGTRDIIAIDLAQVLADKEAVEALFRATFPTADMSAVRFDGESVEHNIGIALDWCAKERKLSDFLEAAAYSKEHGWDILTYAFSYLYADDLIVDAPSEAHAPAQPMQQQSRDEAAEALRQEQAGLRHDQ